MLRKNKDAASYTVGRCSSAVSKLALKASMVSALETMISYTAFNVCSELQLAAVPHGVGVHVRRAVGRGGALGGQGEALQVHRFNHVLKAPGTKRLKLKCDEVV